MNEGLSAIITVETLRDKLNVVQNRISAAAMRAGRAPGEVRLVGVTKGQPVEAVRVAADAGLVWIGENYVQEALAKMAAIDEPELVWHMIGHVQSRKAGDVRENFDWVHSLDSLKLAKKLKLEGGKTVESAARVQCERGGEQVWAGVLARG